MTLTPEQARGLLARLGLPSEEGLSELELRRVQRRHGFEFNPDHRALLAAGLPLGGRWPNWRKPDDRLRRWLAEPVEGVIFDVAENGFWFPAWGSRPAEPTAALAVAKRALEDVPVLVPVYGHRFAPALPRPGLPVLSVVQTDVIVYGTDLAHYLSREFGSADETGSFEPVPFWTELS